MINPYVFIVGCPRSGTTLLQRMVNTHSQIAITPESHWIPLFFEERRGLTSEGVVTPELISRLLEHRKFARLGIGREELLSLLGANENVTFSLFVSRIFDFYGSSQGKALVGDKTPAYIQKLNTLHTLWPQARFVHLIRDGRDACLSIANWRKVAQAADEAVLLAKPGTLPTWKDDPVSTTALWWESIVRLGREAGNSLGPGLYYEIRYESLVRDPAEECASLCQFLGLPYDPAMLCFHEGRTNTTPGLDAKHAWLPVTPGLRAWREQMPAEDVERFEAAVGELLDELGYERACSSPRPESLANAARIRGILNPGLQNASLRGKLMKGR